LATTRTHVEVGLGSLDAGEIEPPTRKRLEHRADELRAFHEYLLDSGARFALTARNSEFSCVAFGRVG
jgi:hypothetical protein